MPALHVSYKTLLSPTGDMKGHAFIMFRVFEARLDIKHREVGLGAAVVVDVSVLGDVVEVRLAKETTFIKC